MSTPYQVGEKQDWTGTRTWGLKHSDYRVWLEHFTEGYEVSDQRPRTIETKKFTDLALAMALVGTLLQAQWDKEATSDRRRVRIPFPDQQ